MTEAASNYEIALKAELRRVVAYRPFIDLRLWTHPDIPCRAFETRKQAAEAALSVS